MKGRHLFIAFLLPLAAQAQIALFSLNGSVETPVGGTFDFGKVGVGDTKNVVLRVRNTGTSRIPLVTLSVNGAGFTLQNIPLLPFILDGGNFLNIGINFTGSIVATYSANLQVNSVSALLVASSVNVATLSVAGSCSGPDAATGNISFGTVLSTASPICTFSLRNRNAQAITVSDLSTSGAGFGSAQGIRTPFTLLSGENVNFTVNFSPGSPGTYSGKLTVDSRIFALSGTAVAPVLPAPLVSYESTPLRSGQQRALTISLAAPAPVAILGDVSLSFIPDTSLVKDDPSVVFAASAGRSLILTVRQGDTQVLLNGQPSAVFQTGTTAGRIRFSLSSNLAFQTDPTTILVIPPDKVAVDRATGAVRTGFVDILVVGYDNTYSTGPVSFSFFDTNGRTLGSGAINADFTSGFRDYFSKAQAGGTFKAVVTFPVSGDATQVGAVDIQFTNSAGSATLPRLTLPLCQLNGPACIN